jgi:hypothetical protein
MSIVPLYLRTFSKIYAKGFFSMLAASQHHAIGLHCYGHKGFVRLLSIHGYIGVGDFSYAAGEMSVSRYISFWVNCETPVSQLRRRNTRCGLWRVQCGVKTEKTTGGYEARLAQ